MAGHPVPQHTQQGVVKLCRDAWHVHQRWDLGQAEEQKQSSYLREVDRHPLGCVDVSPVQLDVHGLLGEAAQFVLFFSKTTTQSCFTWTDGRKTR